MRKVPDNLRLFIAAFAFGAATAVGLLAPRAVSAADSAPPAKTSSTSAKKPAAVKPSAGATTPTTTTAKPARAPAAKPASPAAQRNVDAPRDAEPPTPDPTLAETDTHPFLTGDDWQDTLTRFEQWTSVQALYDAEQVRRMRAKFAARAKATPTADRKEFMKEFDAKLDTLYGKSALDLQNYFQKSLSVASPAYVTKLRQQLPDVVGTTPEQLRERLSRVALSHQSTVEVHQAFERTRQMQIANHEAKSDAIHGRLQRPSADQMASSPGAPASSGRRRSTGSYAQARDYYPQTNSSISYSVIPVMPMFTGSGVVMFGGGVAITITRNR